VRPLASLRIPLSRVISSSPGSSQAIIFMLDAEEEAEGALLTTDGALLTAEGVFGAAVVAGAALVGTGVDVATTVELLVDTVGACGCPSTVSVTGAIIT